jgi:hypothetical protein
MRHIEPRIGAIVDEMVSEGVERFAAIALAPQKSSNAAGYRRAVDAALARLDGTALAPTFTAIVAGPQPRELIRAGVLVPTRILAPDGAGKSLAADPVDAYRRHAQGRKALAFCASVEHAESVARDFTIAGFPAANLDGRLRADERARRVAAFGAGEIMVLCNFRLIAEGFDGVVGPGPPVVVADVTGKNFSELIAHDDFDPAVSACERAMGGEQINALELRLLRANGSPFHAEINIAPLVADGAVIGLQGISRDVTSRKQAEEALRVASALGERLYPLDQVEKLRTLKRLLDLGHRPGKIVGLPIDVAGVLCGNFDLFGDRVVSNARSHFGQGHQSGRSAGHGC